MEASAAGSAEANLSDEVAMGQAPVVPVDRAERRRQQNRLNQQAWRRRRALAASEAALATSDPKGPSTGFWVLKPIAQGRPQRAKAAAAVSPCTAACRRPGRPKRFPPLLHYVAGPAAASAASAHGLARNLSLLEDASTALLHFPLAPDHRLLTLVQYNVLRALLTNMAILACLHAVDTDCGLFQILDRIRPPLPPPAPSADALPADLRPSRLQAAALARHRDRLWVASLPSAALRDNVLRAYGGGGDGGGGGGGGGGLDTDAFCCDLAGGLYEGYDDVRRCGMVVWADPWRVDSWEITDGFAQKWGFLLRGCDALVAATNRWRARRGEDALRWRGGTVEEVCTP